MPQKMSLQKFVDEGYMYLVNATLHRVGVELTVNLSADGRVIGIGDVNDYTGETVYPSFNMADPNVATKQQRAIALLERASKRTTSLNVVI